MTTGSESAFTERQCPPHGEEKRLKKKTARRTLCVFNRTRESFLGLRVAPADTLLRRLRGLLGRLRLKPDDGIWLAPSMGIHTIGMLFAIDLIYLDDANRVIHLVENLGPWRISPIRIRCAGILELKARSIFSSNTQIGDHLLVCTPDEIRTFCQSDRAMHVVVAGAKRA
jgi:uncharacterized membrane protein (UPF0127 family)